MATINVYRVIYHFENSGKIANHPQNKYVAASAGDVTTISNVIKAGLSDGSGLAGHGPSTLVIDSIANAIAVAAQQ